GCRAAGCREGKRSVGKHAPHAGAYAVLVPERTHAPFSSSYNCPI
ncbi:MAG: hypothetical protein AVDCRST_MAG26-2474, partial [uncultured Chloroflexia bacterium]